MLRGVADQGLYRDYYQRVLAADAKQAYCYLVGWASTLPDYECFPSSHGYIRDFRFFRGEDWDFALIPNQKWLLFYFRKPCLKFAKYAREEILNRFPAASESGSGEFTVKLANLDEAIYLTNYIEFC